MEELPGSNGSGSGEQPAVFVPAAPPPPSELRTIFVGPNGIRAGWRLLIYVAIFIGIAVLIQALRGSHAHHTPALEDPVPTLRAEWLSFAVAAFAAWILSRIEKQPWGNYGMAWHNAFRSRFWLGALFGFVALSCVMGTLHVAHCYYIDGLAISGSEIWKYGALWLVAFLGVGFAEEFISRGYAQYTLASGITFWGAALLTSGVFLAAHVSNPGETALGVLDVFLFGMLACFIWWRTGDLWLAVGFHAFWDWGLSFFYSVPDSGIPSMGHLFRIRVQGPPWLSGGSAGPEGSAINIVFDLVYFAIIAIAFPKRKFVGMDDRRKAKETVTVPVIDPSALQG
jgi:hypothetical protein